MGANSENPGVDPIVLVIVLVVVMPVAVVWALSKAAGLRGPLPRPEARSRRPVEALVTEIVPEEHPDDEELEHAGPDFGTDAAQPDPARDP